MELREQLIKDIEYLPDQALRIIRAVVMEFAEPRNDQTDSIGELRRSAFGCMEGKGWIADDFNEEMDEYGRFKSDPGFGTPVKEGWEK